MERRELERSIKHLRSELGAGQPLSEGDRKLLEGILTDAAAVLEREPSDIEGSSGLTERVREAAVRLEGSHPELTRAIGAIADVLSRMGI